MKTVNSQFTVFFQEPFWVGVYERISDNRLEVCKITFGAEPKDYEVHEFLLKHYYSFQFSKSIKTNEKKEINISNPKRLKRQVEKQLNCKGVGTKSQQALQLLHETAKTINKQKTRKQIEDERQRKFDLKQEKKKEKRKGR